MGCWGFGICESDDALDEEYRFLEMANVPERGDRRGPLETHLAQMLDSIFSTGEPGQPNYDYAVSHQVLATLLMQEGCRLTEVVRERLLAGIVHCDEYRVSEHIDRAATEVDGYTAAEVQRIHGRRAAIDALAAQLRAYDIAGGMPSASPSRGLFERIFECTTNCG